MTKKWPAYIVAVTGPVIAALVRWGLLQAVGELPLYITFYPAVFAAAAMGGTGPGLVATILSALITDFFFWEPVWTLTIPTTADAVGMALFLAINICICLLGGRLRHISAALLESETRLRLSHQVMQIGAFELNLQTGVNTWTPELEAMYGLKPGQFEGTQAAWEALVHPEDRPRAVAAVDRTLKSFQPEEGEWRVIWPDGTVHWVVGRFQAFQDPAGRPLRMIGVNIDITDRKMAEQGVKESEERFRALAMIGPYAVFQMSPDWSEMHWLHSRDFLAGTETPSGSWLDKYIFPEDQPHVLAVIHEAIRTKSIFELEHRVRREDGTRGWTLSRAVPWLNAKGEIVEWFGAASDVTKRKEAVEALRESEERFRTMANAIPQLAWIARPDGHVFWFNSRWYEYTGATPEQMEGWGWRSVHDPEQLPQALEQWRHCIATGQPATMEIPLRGADGHFRTFLTRVVPLKDEQGRVSLWFGTHTDVTEQKEAQEVLRHSEERFRTMANTIPQLAWIARPDGHFIWFNRRVYEYTGASPEQLEGWGWGSVLDPQALPKVSELWLHSLATGEPFIEMEFTIRGADGHFRPFLAHTIPVKDEEGRVKLWFGTGTNISELREREKALARQARLIDLAPVATLVQHPDGVITFWSQGAERLYGWTKAEAVGRRAPELLRTEFPEPRESIVARLCGVGGGVWSGELRQYTREGRQVMVESHWLAECNAQGEVVELQVSNTDITERKRLQEHLEDVVEERTASLRDAVAELKHMSYSMVHDMRAPLRAMHGFADLLKESCPDCQHPPAADYLQYIQESSKRLDRLITGALNYSRMADEELSLTPVEIGSLLRGMIQSYPNLEPRVADITLEFRELFVLGNESLLTQCFGNLLDNAVKFVAPGVRPHVRIWAGASTINNQPSTIIHIEDNGIGIPISAREKIFRMFERMHRESEYPGTGVGLAIAKKAVERMNGRLGLESEPGHGSQFWIELPKAVDTQRSYLQHAA